MTHKIISTIPTVYQLNSLSRLMGGWENWGNKYGYERIFESEEEAKEWMHKRNEMLYMADYLTEEEYNENYQSINEMGRMSYDAAYANIEEIQTI